MSRRAIMDEVLTGVDAQTLREIADAAALAYRRAVAPPRKCDRSTNSDDLLTRILIKGNVRRSAYRDPRAAR